MRVLGKEVPRGTCTICCEDYSSEEREESACLGGDLLCVERHDCGQGAILPYVYVVKLNGNDVVHPQCPYRAGHHV